MPDGEEDTGGAGGAAGGELVSPDSGMTTIRSSRSSKESSVFLSDDSPVGEVLAGGGASIGPGGHFLRNPSPLGLSSLSPPVPPERRKQRSSRNKSDNVDLFSFDPLHNSDQSGGQFPNPGVSRDEGDGRAGSSSFSELEELSLLDFSVSNSLGGLESRNSSIDHHRHIYGNDMTDTAVPPTPVNSVVGSRPPSSCGVRFFPEDVVERINGLQHKDSVSSSLSETWDELGFDTQGALSSGDNSTWSRTKETENPPNIGVEVRAKESANDITKQEIREDFVKSENAQRRRKTLEPQLSLITDQTESYDNWNTGSALEDKWNPVSLAYLQLTPPEEEVSGKCRAGITGVKGKTSSSTRKKATVNTLTPDTSKEDDEGLQGKKGDRQMELLDFWTYSAQKGFLKSDSGTTTSYPESLDMWNMTIRDDSLSPLTTPDNISENSGSFCGANPNIGAGASLESPLGFPDGGMAMWNTTIQEDSSSTITSPEGPDNGRDVSHMGSLDANSPDAHPIKMVEEKALQEEEEGKLQSPEEVRWRGNEHNVKIVIEAAEDTTECEETGDNDLLSERQQSDLQHEHLEEGPSPHQGADMSDLPIPGMVTSTSEYDNVGAGTWSLASSPETYASPDVDMIQLEEQSSPFIALTKPTLMDERHDQYQGDDHQKSDYVSEPANQVFLFEGTSELGHRSRGGESDEADWTEQSSAHSPFVLVDCSTAAQKPSPIPHLGQGESAQTQIQTDELLSSSLDDWDKAASKKHNGSESDSPSQDLLLTNVEGKASETMSLSSSSGGERDTMKQSPDSLHPGSQDELRSNSDGDSSGLEMEYIIVSGTVKETEREWRDRPRQGDRQAKVTRKPMGTFSMLSYAATVLQNQAKAAQREERESMGHSGTPSDDTEDLHGNISEASGPTGCGQTQVEEGSSEDKSSVVPRSVSPSLRYPSDHFLKTREEVYVHSQISMEDSDEGGQSPSAPPPCPTSLGDIQAWRGQLAREDTPQAASQPQSPVLTNSSVSHTSSSTGTPLSESGAAADRGLGLPFSGDLMDEENDDEEHEEEVQSKQEEGQSDLLSFTEELVGGPSFQQTNSRTMEPKRDRVSQHTVNYYDEKPIITAHYDEWSTDRTGDHEGSQGTYSPVLRHEDVPSQLSFLPTNENAAYQWTASSNETQGQTQYGYNYHHIDQRTENQSIHSACVDPKSSSQLNTTEVYAEFTTAATAKQSCYGAEQAQSYYEPGHCAEYSLGDPGSKFQYIAESGYGDGSDSMCASELQCSQYQAHSQSQYGSDQAHYQFDEQPFYQSDAVPEREDHARYVPEAYVHFLHSRHSQQAEDGAGMMVKMASSEEAAEEMDNREDPPSSADLSGGSNQRRKLTAPPMNVSLDRSEGSLLSEDALDTEDEALDTGDDLDVNVDEMDTPDEADVQGDSGESSPGAGGAAGGAFADEETKQSKLWRSVVIGEQEHRIDMKCIEPYKRVISHGGYYAEQNAIIVFAACFLPDSNCENYNHVMENLFLYVISTLELMVAEDYMIVYLNGATPRRRMPGFTWMKKCYQMIDRRLKKNLKMFIIVHPSWFIRTLLGITRPFISSKFSSKIKYVHSLQELGEIIPMEYVHIPPSIVKLDTELQDSAAKADKKGNSLV